MKKILLAIILLAPITTFAAWWNPFSWDMPQFGAPSSGSSYFANLLRFGTTTTGCLQGKETASGIVTAYFTGTDCGTGVGGGGGGGTWSTTTSQVTGQFINYPNETDDIVVIGSNASTSAEFYYDPNVFNLFVKSASSTIAGPVNIVGNLSALGNFIFDSQTFDSLTDDATLDNNGGDLQVVDVTCTNCLTNTEVASADLATNVSDADFGDVTVASGVWAVEDDSHAHTGSTLSGIDISADTNLTAGDGLKLTDDDLDCDTASGSVFGCLSSSDWTTFNNKVSATRALTIAGTANQITSSAGAQDLSADRTWTLSFPNQVIFPQYASSTLGFSTVYASSTFWYGGGLLNDCTGAANKLTWNAGTFRCEGDETGAGGTVDGTGVANTLAMWTDSNTLQATSSHPLYVGSIFATSSILFSTLPNITNTYASSTYSSFLTASTTNLNIGGDSLNDLEGDGLVVTGNALLFDCSDVASTGLQCSGEDLQLNATGDWTGTIDGNNFAGGAIGAGELLYGASAGSIAELAAGTAGQILMSGGTGAPSWVATTTFGSGYATTTNNYLTFSTSTTAFQGLTFGQTIIPSAGALTFKPTITGTLDNAGLTNSTISGKALGTSLDSLTNDATLNGSSYNGSSAISDWGLNLANANTWTVNQTFNYSSSTAYSSFEVASTSQLRISNIADGCLNISGGLVGGTGSACGSGGGSSAFEIATTSDIAVPNVAYFTQTGGRTTLGSIATGTISVPTGLTITANRYALGGSTAIGLDTGYVIPLQTTLDAKLTALGSGYATTTQSAITFSTTTQSFNGLTIAQRIIPTAGALTFTPNISGTLDNTGLTNSTISGISLGSNLNNLTNDATLNGSSYNGSAAISDWGINLANANTWTAKQDFYGSASSTLLSANWLKVGGTASTTLGLNGSITAEGLVTFPYSSSTIYSSFETASTSALVVSNSINIFGGGAKTSANALCIQLTGHADLCDGNDGGGGGSSKWTDVGDYTYLTDTDDDVYFGNAVGTSSPFYWDVSATTTYIGRGGGTDSLLTVGSTTINGWTLGHKFSDSSFRLASSSALGTNDLLIGSKSPFNLIFPQGFVSQASSTFVGSTAFGSLSQGSAYIGSGKLLQTTATTSASCSGGVSCTGFNVFGSSPITISSFTYPFPSAATSTTLTLSGGFNASGGTATLGTIAGTIDAGGATAFEIPNGTGPTYGAAGRIALDTTSNNITIATSTNGHIVVASATTTLYAFTATTSPIVSGTIQRIPTHPLPQVATSIICMVTSGTSLVLNLSDGTNDTNSITCSTTETQYAFTSNNSWNAYEAIRIEYGTKTGDTGDLVVRIMGYRTSD